MLVVWADVDNGYHRKYLRPYFMILRDLCSIICVRGLAVWRNITGGGGVLLVK